MGKLLFCIFLISLHLTAGAGMKSTVEASEESGDFEEKSDETRVPLYKLKLEIQDNMELKKYLNMPLFGEEDTYLFVGIACIVGFFASITVFKQEIFSTAPIILLGLGVIFIMLGTT